MNKSLPRGWRAVFWTSVAVLVVSLALVLVSTWRALPLKTGGNWQIDLYRGGLAVHVGLEGSAFWDFQSIETQSRGQIFWLPASTVNSQAPEWCVIVPLVWLTAAATAAIVVSAWRLRHSTKPGVCSHCGYALLSLAAPITCPECVTPHHASKNERH